MIRRLPPKEKKEIEEFREAFLQKFVFFEKLFQKIAGFFEKVLKFREKVQFPPFLIQFRLF
jgi:hypothetical protein